MMFGEQCRSSACYVVQTILLLPDTLGLCFTPTHSTRQGYCFVWFTLYDFR